jgi:hypothetical protein
LHPNSLIVFLEVNPRLCRIHDFLPAQVDPQNTAVICKQFNISFARFVDRRIEDRYESILAAERGIVKNFWPLFERYVIRRVGGQNEKS